MTTRQIPTHQTPGSRTPGQHALLFAPASVQHVGTLDRGDLGLHSGAHSHEGHHLSVSQCPGAWRRIARLGDLPCHTLSRPGAAFIDVYAVLNDAATWENVRRWGLERALVTPADAYLLYTRGEDGQWCYSTHQTLLQATLETELDEDREGAGAQEDDTFERRCDRLDELTDTLRSSGADTIPEFLNEINTLLGEGQDGRPGRIRRERVLLSTPALTALTGLGTGHADASHALLIAWAQAEGEAYFRAPISGVWWHEDLDPAGYSAPRGLIFREQVPEWSTQEKLDTQDRAEHGAQLHSVAYAALTQNKKEHP